MVTMGVFPFQGKTHIVEPGIEPGTSWLVVRNSDHQATRLVDICENIETRIFRTCPTFLLRTATRGVFTAIEDSR